LRLGRACNRQLVSRTMRLIGVRCAHVLCAPLLNGLFVNITFVPKCIDGLLCLLSKIVSQEVLEFVQFYLRVDLPHCIQQFQLCDL